LNYYFYAFIKRQSLMTIDQVYILNMYLFSCNQKDLLNYGPYIHTIAISEETRSLLFILQGEPSNSLKAACMGVTQAMFPLIFKVCVHIKFLLCNILPGLVWIWNDVYEIVAKAFLEGIFMCAPCFLVCARLTTCVRRHTRTAEDGTLDAGKENQCQQTNRHTMH